MKQLYAFSESKVEVRGLRVGNRETTDTLVNEEALLFAKFLRDETRTHGTLELVHRGARKRIKSPERLRVSAV